MSTTEESEEHKVHVRNLSRYKITSLNILTCTWLLVIRNVKSEHIHEIFSNYGTVKSADLETIRTGRTPKHSAYVSFAEAREAEEAVLYMDGGQIDGNFAICKWEYMIIILTTGMIVNVSFVLVSGKKKRDSPGSLKPNETANSFN